MIIVESFEKAPIENMISVLAARPDKVIFLGDTVQMSGPVQKYKEILEKHLNGEINLGELSEEELEEISGGLITEGLITIGLILAGTGLMLTGGAAYLVDYEKRRKGRRW